MALPISTLVLSGQIPTSTQALTFNATTPSAGVLTLQSSSPDVTTQAVPTEMTTSQITLYTETPTFISSTIVFGTNDTPLIEMEVPAVTVQIGTSVTVFPQTIETILVTSTVDVTATNNPVIPPIIVEIPQFTLETQGFSYAQSTALPAMDNQLIPVMTEMSNVNNNVFKIPSSSQDIWSQNVLENTSTSIVPGGVLKILTANYHKFAPKKGSRYSKVISNRKPF